MITPRTPSILEEPFDKLFEAALIAPSIVSTLEDELERDRLEV